MGIGKHSEAGREGGDLAKPIIECLLEVRKPAVVIHVALLRSVNAQQAVGGRCLSLPPNFPKSESLSKNLTKYEESPGFPDGTF